MVPAHPCFPPAGRADRAEIARERYAVRALRGDFDALPRQDTVQAAARVAAVLEASDA